MTAEAKATTPVPPNTTTRLPFSSVLNLSLRAFSAQATMAAAVVNEPAGSANTGISKGGTIAALARFIMSRASIARLPPMNMAVRFTPSGPREKIASCTSPVTSSTVTEV